MHEATLAAFNDELTKIALSAKDVGKFLTKTPHGGALAGAALGGGVGAGVGALTGKKGERKKRALMGAGIGAGVGGLTGAAIGSARSGSKAQPKVAIPGKPIAIPQKPIFVPSKIELKRAVRKARKPKKKSLMDLAAEALPKRTVRSGRRDAPSIRTPRVSGSRAPRIKDRIGR